MLENGTLTVDDTIATDDAVFTTLARFDLGSVSLGGIAPSTLVRAGHIREHLPEAATLADALFRGQRTPHCLHWF